jgi:hypothetical protein
MPEAIKIAEARDKVQPAARGEVQQRKLAVISAHSKTKIAQISFQFENEQFFR